jgi:hypothetical protein
MGGRARRARRGKKTEDRGQTVQNTEYPPASPEGEADGGQVEQQNKEPQNDEVITSIRLRRILRFRQASAQMKSTLIVLLLNSEF